MSYNNIFSQAFESLKNRCAEHNLQTEVLEKPIRQLIINIPEGRDYRGVSIAENQESEKALQIKFETYKFIKGYEAIWSEKLKVIECGLLVGHIFSPAPVLSDYRPILYELGRRLQPNFPNFYENASIEDIPDIILPSIDENLALSIGFASPEYAMLCGMRNPFPMRGLLSLVGNAKHVFGLSLKITGKSFSKHDDATSWLITIGNSLLFQIDLLIEYPLMLQVDRQLLGYNNRQYLINKAVELQPRFYDYDSEAITHYWYGRIANGLPLFQFLSFYHVLEFYFPVYSKQDAQQKIRHLIKDPRFNVDRDTDIANILDVIQITDKGRAFGEEEQQLKATIQACVREQKLRDFIENDHERNHFYQDTKISKKVSIYQLSIESSKSEILTEVTKRVYDIRCKLVHAKGTEDYERILPFSPEASLLKHDIEIIEFLAQQVLIANSKQVKLS